MKFLQGETMITGLLTKFIDLMLVNLLWVFCCIPIITIGASTTAMYDVTMKMALHENADIIGTFFKSFLHNFRKSTGLYLIVLFTGAFLCLDFWCATKWNLALKFIFQVVILSVGYFYLCVSSHVFPVLAYFDEPVFKTIKHSFLLAMRNGIYTVFIVVMDLIPVFIFFLAQALFWKYLFVFLTLIFALIAYLNSLHLVRLFDPKKVKELHEFLAAKER